MLFYVLSINADLGAFLQAVLAVALVVAAALAEVGVVASAGPVAVASAAVEIGRAHV